MSKPARKGRQHLHICALNCTSGQYAVLVQTQTALHQRLWAALESGLTSLGCPKSPASSYRFGKGGYDFKISLIGEQGYAGVFESAYLREFAFLPKSPSTPSSNWALTTCLQIQSNS